jgi:hypothetical protein
MRFWGRAGALDQNEPGSLGRRHRKVGFRLGGEVRLDRVGKKRDVAA